MYETDRRGERMMHESHMEMSSFNAFAQCLCCFCCFCFEDFNLSLG